MITDIKKVLMKDCEVSVDVSTLKSKTGHPCLDPDSVVRLQEGGGALKALVTGNNKHFRSKEIVGVQQSVTRQVFHELFIVHGS